MRVTREQDLVKQLMSNDLLKRTTRNSGHGNSLEATLMFDHAVYMRRWKVVNWIMENRVDGIAVFLDLLPWQVQCCAFPIKTLPRSHHNFTDLPHGNLSRMDVGVIGCLPVTFNDEKSRASAI